MTFLGGFMKDIIFKGCGCAIVTPFTKDNTINYEEYKKLIDFQISNNVSAIIVCGTTGESATLSDEERKHLISFTVSYVNKRCKVIAGTGSNNTSYSITLTKYAETVGVDACLVVTPYYNKTTQDGLIKHYSEIASSTNLPIILYNVPSRTGVDIEPQTCFVLSKIKNIVAIKEASGNISKISEIASLCKENLYIYSGNDGEIVPIMAVGGIGVISVLSNIYPSYTSLICENMFENKIYKARELQLKAYPLIKALFSEPNPIPIKYALNKLGFNVGSVRLPLVEFSKNKERMIDNGIVKIEE